MPNMVDQSNTLNTVFTADTSDAQSKIKKLVLDIASLGNMSEVLAIKYNAPRMILKDFLNVLDSNSKFSGVLERQLQLVIDRARGLSPSFEDLSRFASKLGIDLSKVGTESSLLVKGLMALENQGEVAQKSFSNFAEIVGINSEKLIPFANNIKIVYDHLSSIPEASSKYATAQSEISDATLLSRRATQLLNKDILAIGEGYLALSSDIVTVGTSISSQEEFFKSLSKENKKLAETVREVIAAKEGDKEATQAVITNAVQLVGSVQQVRSALKLSTEDTIKQEGTLRLMGQAALSVADINKKLSIEQGLLTKAYYNEATILQVLNGEIKATVPNLVEMVALKYKNREIIQNLSTEYPKLGAGISSVRKDQEFLSETVKMFNEVYGPVYGKVLQDMAEKDKLAGTALKSHEQFANTLMNEGTVLESVSGSSERTIQAIGNYEESINKASYASGAFSESSKELITVSQGIRTAQEQLKIAYDGTAASSNESGMYSKALTVSLKDLEQAQQKTNASFKEAKTVYSNLKDETDKAGKATEDAGNKAKNAKGFFDQFFNTLKNFVVFQIASSIVSGFMQSITGAVQAASQFDQTLHSLKAITGATVSEMAGMSDTIKNIAASSIYSTTAIGEGLQIMAQAGLTAAESVSAIKAASNLATGTLEKMENTVDLLTSTMSSYNINALESGRVSDILAIAVNKSKLSIDKLRTSLNYVGVIAAQSGLSLEQTSASLMVLADRGMKASTIGTGFRQVLDKLIAPNEKLREAYQAHGIALEKISPLTAGYETSLKNLSIALYDSDTKTVDTAKAFELFGIRGAQAAAILIQAYTSGEWKDAMNSFDESGTAAKMAAEQMLGLGAMWDNLVAKVSVLMASLGEGGLTAALKGIVKSFSFFIDGIQAFLNMNFGGLGVLIQILTAFTALLGVTSVGLTVYTLIMTSATTATGYLSVAIGYLSRSFMTLTAAMMSNPTMALVTVIAAVVMALKIYSTHLDSVVEGHNKLVNEAKQMVGTLDLLQKSLSGMSEGSREYETLLKRLKSEYPELTKEIQKVTGITDISTLSYKELSDAMEKVRQIKLNEAIDENVKALRALTDQVNGVGAIFVYLGEVGNRIIQMFSALADVLIFVTTLHQRFANLVNPVAEEMIAANAKTAEAVKNLAQSYVDAGKDISKSLEEQKATSIAKLESDVRLGKYSQETYTELLRHINTTYTKIAERLGASKIHYEKFTNSVKGIYGDLSAKQRAEIQSVVDEEEKAVEKFMKFGRDKKLSAEEIDGEIYAIRLRYQLKALGLLSDSVKKEYETQTEKYTREEGLIEQKLALVQSGIDKEQKLYDNLSVYRDGANKKDYAEMLKHKNNLATLNATHEDIVRAQRNITFEHQKKLMSDTITEIKANVAFQMTFLQGFEQEKIKLAIAEADATLTAKNLMLKAEQDYIAKRIESGKASKAEIEASADREKALILEVTQAQTASINARLSDMKLWLDKSNEYQAQRLEYSKDMIKQEQEALKRNYDEQVSLAKSALDRKLVLITTEQKSTDILYKYHSEQEQNALKEKLKNLETEELSAGEFAKRIFDAKSEYFNQGLQRYQDDSNKQINLAEFTTKSVIEIEAKKQKAKIDYYTEIDRLAKENLTQILALEEKDLQNTLRIINEKFLIEQSTNQSLKDLQNVQSDYSKTTQAKILQVTTEGTSARIALATQETEATKTEYNKREEAFLNQITRSGKTVIEDITLRGSALVKETELTKKELSDRSISWVQFGEEVFRVVDKQTLAVQLGSATQAGVVKKGIDDQILSIRTVTTESIAELKKQGAQYEVFNGQVVKITTGTYADIKKNFTNLTDDEKKMFVQLEKDILISLDKRKQGYLDYVTSAKANIESLKAAEIAALAKVDELVKNKRTISESFAESERKNRQTMMTETQKFNDEIKNINMLMNKAKTTEDKKYLDAAVAASTALIGSEVKEGETIVKSKRDVMEIVSQLLKDEAELSQKLNEKEIEKTKEAAAAMKAKYEELKKSVDEAKVKIDELGNMKVEIQTTSFLASTSIIFEEIDKILAAIKSIKENAVMEINDAFIKEQLRKLSSTFDIFIAKVGEVKNQPIELKIEDAGLTEAITKHAAELEELKKTQGLIKEVNFGQVESWEKILESLNNNKTGLQRLMEYITTEFKPVATIDFKAKGVEGKENISEAIVELKAMPVSLQEAYTASPNPTLATLFNMDVGDSVARTFSAGIDWIKEKIKQLVDNPTKSTHDVVVTGIMDLQAAIDKHSQLDGTHTDSYHTVHVTTVEDGESGDAGNQRTGGYIAARFGGFIQKLRNGGAFSGKLPGYGGGDIVNAKLEPGEFVLRKEAVRNIGVNALRGMNNLNSSVAKGFNHTPNNQQQEQLFSGQLHTINLNIGNVIHKVYGDSNVLNDLTSSLRRTRLMTA
jgi:TP901 family phage tail tape measure protein